MSDTPIPELPADISALLREARSVPEAPPTERRKVAARLALSTGLMIPSATLAGAKTLASSWALKTVGVTLLVAVGAATLALSTTTRHSSQRSRPPARPVPAVTSTPRRPGSPVSGVTSPPLPAPPPATVIVPQRPPPGIPHVPPARSVVERVEDGLADEVSLIQQARDALTRGDTRRARAALAAHAQDFPNGHLVPEREALRVRALAESGDLVGAESARQRFHQRFPDSVLGLAVDRALDAGSAP